jgi:hypothetical protein
MIIVRFSNGERYVGADARSISHLAWLQYKAAVPILMDFDPKQREPKNPVLAAFGSRSRLSSGPYMKRTRVKKIMSVSE